MKFDSESIFRKALLASLKTFYGRICYPSQNGEVKYVPIILDNNRDRAWNREHHEYKDFICGNELLNGEVKPVPRATLVYKPFQVDFSEFLNDNVRMKVVEKQELEEDKIKNLRGRLIPITIPLTLEVKANHLNEAFWICESMVQYFDSVIMVQLKHNGIENIPVQIVPDVSANMKSASNINMNAENGNIELSFDFTLKFSYPKIFENSTYTNNIKSSDVNLSSE